jgi:hypothetical protein
MNIVNIIYMIEKSNLSDDEKASCIEVIRELERKLREETLRSNLLVNASEKANGKRRTAKMLKYATAMEQEATKPVKIKFKKFDLTEMKNPLIRIGVIKNIIGSAHGFNNFVNWELLKGCLGVFEKTEYAKNIDGMILFMTDIYSKASSDAANDTDEVIEYLSKHCPIIESTSFRPFCGLPKDLRKERVLDVLNKIKEYNNTGEDYYTALYDKT